MRALCMQRWRYLVSPHVVLNTKQHGRSRSAYSSYLGVLQLPQSAALV